LSYGQKRLLSFAYYLACNPSAIVVDELVNGLHHGWIDYCIESIGARQAFLTSQNPLLFDYLQLQSSADVRDKFVLCNCDREGGNHHIDWARMSESEATMVFDAYEAGIEHVGQILRTRGLW
jgi:hypothetical protein